MAVFVPPEAHLLPGKSTLDFIENKMFPESALVFGSQFLPSAVITDKAGVERVHLGRGDDLGGFVAGEGFYDVCDPGGRQHRQVIGDGGPADFDAKPRAQSVPDFRLSPAAILGGEPDDQLADIVGLGRATSPGVGTVVLPGGELAEPSENRGRWHS